VTDPVRVVFVGGPLCGTVWWPWTNSIASHWNHEVAGDTGELGHSEFTTGNVPDYVHEVDEHMICVHYNDEEFLYTWRDGDTYEHEAWTMIETYDQDIL